jgi:hypothetical protein
LRRIDDRLKENQGLSRKVVTAFSVEWFGSGVGGECRLLMLGQAHAFGQIDAEAVEERRLGGVGLGDASQADLAVRRGRQHHIVRLDACKLFEDRTR